MKSQTKKGRITFLLLFLYFKFKENLIMSDMNSINSCADFDSLMNHLMKRMLNTAYGYHAAVTGSPNPIRKVIFNPPATTVFWFDGAKTVVQARGDDEFNPEVGLAMAISKHYLCDICGLKRYDGVFNKFIPHNHENKE